MSATVIKLNRKIKIKSKNNNSEVNLFVKDGSLSLTGVEIEGISTDISNAKEFKLNSSSIHKAKNNCVKIKKVGNVSVTNSVIADCGGSGIDMDNSLNATIDGNVLMAVGKASKN